MLSRFTFILKSLFREAHFLEDAQSSTNCQEGYNNVANVVAKGQNITRRESFFKLGLCNLIKAHS